MVKYKSNRKQVKQKMSQANKNVLKAVGKASEGYVKLNTAVDTGALRDSISYKIDEKSVLIGSTLTSEDYPIFVEKGTSRTPPQPYISTGVKNNMKALKKIAEGAYKL